MKELSEFIDSEEAETSPRNQPSPSSDTPPPGLVKLLRHMQANADFYRVMIGKQGDPAFYGQAFHNYIEEGYRRILSRQASQYDPNRLPVDFIVNDLMHAGVGAIVWWLENDQPYSPEQMEVWLYQLSMASIRVSFEGLAE